MLNDYVKTCIMFQAAVFKWVISVLCVQCHNCCFVWSGWAELDEEWCGVLISLWPLIWTFQTRVSILFLFCYVTLKNTSSAILLNLDQNLDFIYFMVFSHMQVFSLHKYRNTVYKERTEFYVSWAQYLTFAWYFLIPYYTDSTYPNKSLMESLN